MPAHARKRPRRRVALIAAGLLAVAGIGGGVAIAGQADDEPSSPAPASPVPAETTPLTLAGSRLYVDPAGAAAEQVRTYQSAGRTDDAALIAKIAEQPVATWFADAEPGFDSRARQLVTDAASAGQLPVLTLYHIPHRDCGGHSAGGAADGAAYRRWISALASALQGQRAVIVLEPDAVAQAVQGCLKEAARAERYALLGEAIDTFRAMDGMLVYLDAGNPSWIRDPAAMTAGLKKAGVARTHGFALNVANFETTASNVTYGGKLSRLLGGAHFVVDTSRNGKGPAQIGAGNKHWCNPAGRKLGEAPTTRTQKALVDAYLWIKRPGESDGACSDGAPPAGQWWPEYALELAR